MPIIPNTMQLFIDALQLLVNDETVPNNAPLQVMTPDAKIYTITEIVHEAPEPDNPVDDLGTVWVKLEEF